MIRVTALLAIITLSGCARGVGVDIDPAFSPDETSVLIKALDAWPDNVYDDEHTIRFIRVDHLDACGGPALPGHFLAGCTVGRDIRLVMSGDPDRDQRAAEHEIGHALGLGHIADRPSIMSPTEETQTTGPTDEDVADALAHRH